MATIKFTFTPDGKTKIDAEGFIGEACKDATRQFEKALGLVTSRKNKTDFYDSLQAEQQAHITGSN